jgi:hypothetical protein
MSSQTGECQIDSIEGTTVKGYFKSMNDGNVGGGDELWAAMFLKDAFQSLAGRQVDEAALRRAIKSVSFSKPRTPSTSFVIEVADARVLEGLQTGYWESYYIG